jgi:sulfate transport system permease protein
MTAATPLPTQTTRASLQGTRSPLGKHGVLPGFGLTLGYTLTWLGLIVLLPLAALASKAATAGWGPFWAIATSPRTLASLKVSFGAAAIAAAIASLCGFVISWVLVRYRFFGKSIVDAVVDLPFAMPTAVSGIALTTLYSSEGWIGSVMEKRLGLTAPAYSFTGIVIALIFISMPFAVRTLQPALEELEADTEDAAASLGASRWATFWRIIFPTILPSLLTGFALSFARALGEYGSVVFISGNKAMETEITPLLIITKLEEYDYVGATVLATIMLVISFALLLIINILQWWTLRRLAGGR